MKLNSVLLFTILILFSSCNGQNTSRVDAISLNGQYSNSGFPEAKGENVSEIDKSIYIIFQDKDDNFWFGSDGQGVYLYDGKTISHFTKKQGLPNERIREIQQDKSGNIYITTLEGICKFDGHTFTTLIPIESNDWKLEPDDLWFKGNSMENGPYRYDGKSLHHLKFPKHYLEDEYYTMNPKPVASPYGVYTIYKDSKGNMWFGTAALGACRYDGKTFRWIYEKQLTYTPSGGSFGIRSIFEDKDGKFWLCNTKFRYTVFPKDTSEKRNDLVNYKRENGIDLLKETPDGDQIYYMSMVKDTNHDLWMVTYNLGVWRYDGKNMIQYPVKDGGKDITLYSIYQDNRGELWLGTHNAGVYKFNGITFEKFIP